MNLKFLCVSVAPLDDDKRAAIHAQFETYQTDCHLEARRLQAESQACGRLLLSLNLNGLSHMEDAAAVSAADQLLEWLAESSAHYGVSWDVGHELDPSLGRISSDQDRAIVSAEMATAIQIARSLADLIVDDEFVDPDPVHESDSVEQAFPAETQQQWSELLESEPPFIPFPEME